jgi:hyperosmotically inducible protein
MMSSRVVTLAAIVLGGLLTVGCVPLVVGGAAVGGYYLGKDDRDAAQIAEDSSITAKVKSRLIGDKYVDAFDINVDTYENVVTLHGNVTNMIAREQAEKLATGVPGVMGVENQIKVLKAETPAESASEN